MKENVIAQIELIKEQLVDKDRVFPLSHKALFTWSFVSAFLTLLLPSLKTIESLLLVLAITFVLGFILDYWFIKESNEKADIVRHTPTQKFIFIIFNMIVIFSSLITIVLFFSKYISLICPMWLSTIGFATYIAGYLSREYIRDYGLIMFCVGVFLIVGFLVIDTSYSDYIELYGNFSKYITLVFLSGGYFYLAMRLKNES